VPSLERLGVSTQLLLLVLIPALLAFAAVAADVVDAGRLSELDADVADWVARSMPSWAEWLARPFTWLGGAVGVTVVVVAAAIWLFTRHARVEAALLVVVALGIQLLVFTAKHAYARPRPDVGSAIRLPSSYSFPSGHAATGIAVFGLLGLLAATASHTRRRRRGDRCGVRDRRPDRREPCRAQRRLRLGRPCRCGTRTGVARLLPLRQ
jgi:undecaprenyl-diphosphatase